MAQVMKIIVIVLTFLLIYGCEGKKGQHHYKLPDKIEHPNPGKVLSISPRALIDSLNDWADIDIYFIEEAVPEDPSDVVQLPGMKTVHLGEMFYVAETLKTDKPLYLISLYGPNARKLAHEFKKFGITTYYLDGGSYRLAKEMRQKKWKIFPSKRTR